MTLSDDTKHVELYFKMDARRTERNLRHKHVHTAHVYQKVQDKYKKCMLKNITMRFLLN